MAPLAYGAAERRAVAAAIAFPMFCASGSTNAALLITTMEDPRPFTSAQHVYVSAAN